MPFPEFPAGFAEVFSEELAGGLAEAGPVAHAQGEFAHLVGGFWEEVFLLHAVELEAVLHGA